MSTKGTAGSDAPLVQRDVAGTAEPDADYGLPSRLRSTSASSRVSLPDLNEQETRLIAYGLATARVLDRKVIGARAVDQDSWYMFPAPDGKGPVKALRSRISDLERNHGFGFDHRRRPDGRMREYVLVELPPPKCAIAELTPAEDEDDGEQLALEVEATPPAAPSRPRYMDVEGDE